MRMKSTSSLSLLLLVLALVAIGTIAAASAVHHPHPHPHHHQQHPHHSVRSSVIPSHPTTILATTSVANTTTATFYQYLYLKNTECSSSEKQLISMQQTGVCFPNIGNTSIQYFCDTEGAYYVWYQDTECQMQTGAQRYGIGCRGDGYQYQCANAELGPPLPFSWPPENFIVQTQCSDGSDEIFCSSNEEAQGIVCTDTAYIANECAKLPSGSSIAFCTDDAEWMGFAWYPTSDCSGSFLPNQIQLSITVCNATASNVQCAGSPFPLDQYPTYGFVNTGSNCQPSSPNTQIIYQAPGACYESLELTCSPDNSTITENWYRSPDGDSCPAGGLNSQQSYRTGQCMDQNIYFCDGSPIPL